MLETQSILEIISGKRRGVVSSIVRCGLGLLTPIYRAVICWRNWQFDRAAGQPDCRRIKTASVPVISIGNLTTGGTGKTPMVIWVARELRARQLRVAIISRGYKSSPAGQSTARNDEAIELEFRLPDVPHLQDPDRHRMAEIAVEELETEIVVLDDGFQHRQLHRDLDLVLVDASNPFGYGRLLPRGLLREPISSLRRADVIILTRCELVDKETRQLISDRITAVNSHAVLAHSRTRPDHWMQFDNRSFPLEHLQTERVVTFCGIGNPTGFSETINRLGLGTVESMMFDDHHHYTREDLERLASVAVRTNATAFACTHKDLVKIAANQIDGIPVYALMIETQFISGEDQVVAKIAATSLLSPQ
jgi:tetraacyldisaccharide 4'-kinase